MAQLKVNFMPACVLLVENSWVKIISGVKYFNGGLLNYCLHQAKCRACGPMNVILILNELLNET